MFKRNLNVLIFIFIFALYFFTFLMIYDTFRERKLNNMSKDALNILEKATKEEKKEPLEGEIESTGISYAGYTILGKLEIPSVGIDAVILKEHTYSAMNLGVIKTYGVDLNTPGGFVLSGHNFRGKSTFLYSIKNLSNGSKIYITDVQGQKMQYIVYSVQRNVSPDDTSYYAETDDYHVAIVTCENGGKARIVVKARVETGEE